ncbi:hypothetical protein ALNOE001_01610 [Candidatus Methanobinarius endosymbioticus]|uniref:Right handed beta helix domain-containing protein n=1 Tax=Candidatus Methanobinarius endosymbioticus TaxID=2006182 RepID=A0A366ME13_9EURY|nr:hypothetical protein ALNOE001_01610 [Candidatus Methanobinarius endosymbioticus]
MLVYGITNTNNLVMKNSIIRSNGRHGLQVATGSNITIANNTVSENALTHGTNLWFQRVNGLYVHGNNVTLGEGGYIDSNTSCETGIAIDVYNSNVYIYNNSSDNGIHGITVGGTNNNNINIYSNSINSNGKFLTAGYGINVNSGAGISIYNNLMLKNPVTIYLTSSNCAILI